MQKINISHRSIVLSATTVALLMLPHFAAAQSTLFFDDFNGPTLNSVYQASLPN